MGCRSPLREPQLYDCVTAQSEAAYLSHPHPVWSLHPGHNPEPVQPVEREWRSPLSRRSTRSELVQLAAPSALRSEDAMLGEEGRGESAGNRAPSTVMSRAVGGRRRDGFDGSVGGSRGLRSPERTDVRQPQPTPTRATDDGGTTAVTDCCATAQSPPPAADLQTR